MIAIRPWVAAALIAAATVGTAPAAPAALRPGEAAPPILLEDVDGVAHRFDRQTSATLMVVFVKADERYTSETLTALNSLLAKYPDAARGMRRWIVMSRMGSADPARALRREVGDEWTVLLDRDNVVSEAYRIIATPTVALISPERRIHAINPGYDFALESRMRRALGELRGVDLETVDIPKVNMTLQIARRVKSRGLWDKALDYYRQAADIAPLAPDAEIDIAEIYLEIEDADRAIAILKGVDAGPELRERLYTLLRKARALKAGRVATPAPPKVYR